MHQRLAENTSERHNILKCTLIASASFFAQSRHVQPNLAQVMASLACYGILPHDPDASETESGATPGPQDDLLMPGLCACMFPIASELQ